nr:hypothetical protein Iba_chr02eCG7790 [Ipomoea batatas]
MTPTLSLRLPQPLSNAVADTKLRTPTPFSSATHNAATTVSTATSSEPLPLLLLIVRSTVAASEIDLLLVMEQHVAVMNTMRGSYENEANVTGF